MKKYILILVVTFGFAFTLSAAQGPNAVGEAWVKAFAANDLEGVMATYAPDAHLFPPDAVEAVGTEAIRANYAALMNAFTVKETKILDAHHEIVGNLSYAWGRFSVTLVPKAGGDPITMEGRFSDVSRKIKGKWLYIVDHASVNPTPPQAQTQPSK
jgi:ketosteroid isomerase-like protein